MPDSAVGLFSRDASEGDGDGDGDGDGWGMLMVMTIIMISTDKHLEHLLEKSLHGYIEMF